MEVGEACNNLPNDCCLDWVRKAFQLNNTSMAPIDICMMYNARLVVREGLGRGLNQMWRCAGGNVGNV